MPQPKIHFLHSREKAVNPLMKDDFGWINATGKWLTLSLIMTKTGSWNHGAPRKENHTKRSHPWLWNCWQEWGSLKTHHRGPEWTHRLWLQQRGQTEGTCFGAAGAGAFVGHPVRGLCTWWCHKLGTSEKTVTVGEALGEVLEEGHLHSMGCDLH